MPKDTFWFSHDYNSRSDKEMVRLRMKLGVAGIGIFWCIVEMLHEEGGYLLHSECERIAFELGVKMDDINQIINEFDLFKSDEEKFWSDSAIYRIDLKNSKSIKARESAFERWNKTKALRTQKKCNAIKDIKDIKEKKGKKIENDRNTDFLMWQIYDKSWDEYKMVLNGHSKEMTEEIFKSWKEFVDFVEKNEMQDLFKTMFISPKDFGKLQKENGFTKDLWLPTLKSILGSGVKKEHNLFFRIPQFMQYASKKDVHTKKGFTEAPSKDFNYGDMKY